MKRAISRLAIVSVAASALVAACGWDPSRPFERDAPQVKEAIQHYDAGDAAVAAALLEDYLLTGVCNEGNIGTPNRLVERPNGTFDLGLSLFKIGEAYGHRFGDEENDAGFLDPNLKGMRSGIVECALRILRRVSEDASQPASLRARARYLEGNLLFLTAAYKEAVTAYDKALALAPGMGDGGPIGLPDGSQVTYTPDPVGRDAAYNRAIALRRIEDKKDAGDDGGGDGGGEGGSGDGGGEGGANDGGNDGGGDSGKGNEGDDGGKDAGGNDEPDGGQDASGNPPPKPEDQTPDAGAPPPSSRQSQDDRILDQLENAPTVQQEAARKQAGRRRVVGGMTDK